MTQSTLRSGLTPTLYPHPRNLSPKKITAQLARYFPKLASTPSTSSSIPKITAQLARYFPKLASITPLKASDTIALCSFIFASLLTITICDILLSRRNTILILESAARQATF